MEDGGTGVLFVAIMNLNGIAEDTELAGGGGEGAAGGCDASGRCCVSIVSHSSSFVCYLGGFLSRGSLWRVEKGARPAAPNKINFLIALHATS